MILELDILFIGATREFAERVVSMCAGPSQATIEVHTQPEAPRSSAAFADGRYDLVIVPGRAPGDDELVAELLSTHRPLGSAPLISWWPEARGEESHEDTSRIERMLRCAFERCEMLLRAADANRLYQAAFEHSSIGMVLASPEGRLIECNAALERILGYRRDEILGRRPSDFTHPDDVDPSVRMFRDIAQLRLSRYEAEKRYIHRSGKTLWAHLLVSAVLDDEQDPVFFVVQVSDISRRKKSEESAGSSQRLVDSIRRVQAQYIRGGEPAMLHREIARQLARLSGSPDAFAAEVRRGDDGEFVLDVQTLLGRFDQASRQRAGRRGLPEQISPLGRPLVEALEADEIRALEGVEATQALEMPSAVGALERFLIVPLYGKDGPIALIGLAGSRRLYSAEAIDYLSPLVSTSASVLSSLRQVLRRRTAERKLVESQRALLNLMHNLPGMAYRSDADGERTLTFASEGCLELTGYAPGDLVDNRRLAFAELIHTEDRERVEEQVRWALLENRRFEFTYRIRCASGEEKWIWEQGGGVVDEHGETLFVEGFLSDVTAQRRAEEERLRFEARVQQSHKLESLGVLAGGIAHDFNNLLMGILGHAGLASRRLEADHPVYASLTEIEQAAQRAARLTDHMLAFTGRGTLRPRPVDLSSVLQDSAPVLEKLLPARVALELRLADELPSVETDLGQMQQVLVQLVRNSAEALGDEAGRIELTTELIRAGDARLARATVGPPLGDGDFVSLCVSDEGPGMPEDVQLRAFDPFFTTKGFGRGLGLSTVLGIMRSHGGHLQIESARGEGTCVRLLLPVVHEPIVEITPRPSNGRAPVDGRPRVLVIDDERVVRSVASAMLEDAGYEVIEAEDGLDGIEQFKRLAGDVHAVLLDLSMPRLGGEETLVEIRKIRPDARILLTSGFSEQDAMHRIARRRGVGFIQKPYRVEELLDRLEDVLYA